MPTERWRSAVRGGVLLLALATAACGGDERERLPEGWQLEDDDRERLMEGWRLDGREVPRSEFWIQAGETHCEWEDALVLDLRWPPGDAPAPGAGSSFVRDPGGVMDDLTVDPFVPDADLPDDAVDTGYENAAGMILWVAGDLSTAFLVDGDTVEAWPALSPWVCA